MSTGRKSKNSKRHDQCVDWVRMQYTEAGWNCIRTVSGMTDLIASKDKKSHYVRVKTPYGDQAQYETANINNFVQHSISGSAEPIIAEVVTKSPKDNPDAISLSKVSTYNANTNARVIVKNTTRKAKDDQKQAPTAEK